jgi:hypothetical protein
MPVSVNKMKFFSYSKKEWLIAIILLPPFAFVLNWILFGGQYFSSLKDFLFATFITFDLLLLSYISCGMVAVVMRNRYPDYRDTFRRISFSLLIYIAIMVTTISIVFWGYDYFNFLG